MLKAARTRLLLIISAYVLLTPLISMAGDRESLEDFHEDASRLFYQQDYQSSLIQLKNALQIQPEYVPSLVLSAQVWTILNNPEAAESALIKARALGADRRFINLKLAEVYRQQKKYQSIIDELSIRGLNTGESVELLGYIAEAHLALNQESKAIQTIHQAEAINPGALRPNMAKIRLEINRQQLDEAIRLGQQLVKAYPNSTEAWNLYASAQHADGQLSSALKNYNQALKAGATNLDARMARVGLLLDLQRTTEALPDLEYLREHYPYEPRAAYFRGLTYARLQSPDNDYAAQSKIQLKNCTEIIAQLPSDSVQADQQLSMIAALAHYGLSEFEASKNYLSQYLTQHPYDLGANRLMGDTLIKLNDPLSAIRYLKTAYSKYPDDQQTLKLLAAAYSQAGHHEQATELLQEVNETNTRNNTPDLEVDTRLALSMMQSRNFETGINQLKAVYDRDPTQYQAGFSLILALLKDDQYTAALFYAQRLSEHSPNDMSAQNLLGVAQHAAGKPDAAKSTFQRILDTVPGALPPQINLAKAEYALGDIKTARQRLELALKQHPDNGQVTLALAKFNVNEEKFEEALRLAESAYQLDKKSIDARRLLIELYIKQQAYDSAETLALDTVSFSDNAFESRFDANLLLGQVYQQIGQPRKAVSLYKTMTKDAGFHADSLYQIAQGLIKLQSWEAARHALYKAQEGNPDHIASQQDYIQVQLVLKEYEDAYKRSLVFIKKYPDNLTGYLLAGESLTKMERFPEAQQQYEQGLKQGFDPQLALNQAKVLRAQGENQNAGELLEHYWQQTSDTTIGSVYSLYLIQGKLWDEAQKTLATLLKSQSTNAGLLNNMAYVLDKRGQKQALNYAQAAYKYAPENPFVNDTLGWLLVKSGKPGDGLKYLRQAVVRFTNKPELRYHLGKALFDLGRNNEARRELEQALNSGDDFEGKQEAEGLLQTLSQKAVNPITDSIPSPPNTTRPMPPSPAEAPFTI